MLSSPTQQASSTHFSRVIWTWSSASLGPFALECRLWSWLPFMDRVPLLDSSTSFGLNFSALGSLYWIQCRYRTTFTWCPQQPLRVNGSLFHNLYKPSRCLLMISIELCIHPSGRTLCSQRQVLHPVIAQYSTCKTNSTSLIGNQSAVGFPLTLRLHLARGGNLSHLTQMRIYQ